MLLDQFEFLGCKSGGLVEHGVVDADFAHVVQQSGRLDVGHEAGRFVHGAGNGLAVIRYASGVALGVMIFGVHGHAQGGDGAHMHGFAVQIQLEGIACQHERRHEQHDVKVAVGHVDDDAQQQSQRNGGDDVGQQAADILALFDERLRHDVMLRIATFGGVQPAALAELTEVLNGLLDGQNLKRSKMGGVRTAAEIINLMKTQQEEAVITAVREFDGELAQKIIDEMFLFENLVDVDDRSIQRLLQEVDSESLLIALKGAEQPLREKFLRNMSQRAADILRDDLANRGPVRLSQVENEQKAILLIVRRLAETGEMVIGSGEDTYV